MKSVALNRHLRLPALLLLSLTFTIYAWGQTTMGTVNSPGLAGANTAIRPQQRAPQGLFSFQAHPS